MQVTIDGTQIRTQTDFHNTLGRLLDFGPYYGHNSSGLWDRLTTDVERPVEIVWESSGISRELMGIEAFDAIATVLRDAADRDESNHPADERLTVVFA
ncbi:barstar family protein [Nocardia sp. NPDC059091]|uniref:barstar family protein n=1 Tax=unclassified Nocardia TaxID=2637762 RepID=UPI0036789B72